MECLSNGWVGGIRAGHNKWAFEIPAVTRLNGLWNAELDEARILQHNDMTSIITNAMGMFSDPIPLLKSRANTTSAHTSL